MFVTRAVACALLLALTTDVLLPKPANASHIQGSVEKLPILVVDGATQNGAVELSLEDLLALPQHVIETSTPWLTGVHSFAGPTLYDVLEHVGLTGQTLSLHALNDYAVDIPVSEVTPEAPVVAVTLDGKAMSVRNKGPLWVIYPFDSEPAFRSEVIYARSIWQLSRIDARP